MTNINNTAPLPFAEKLRMRRLSMRLSQADIAEKAGITRNYMAQIENGSPLNLSWVVLSRVCDALGMALVMDAREVEGESK